jgi:hypothetical protein
MWLAGVNISSKASVRIKYIMLINSICTKARYMGRKVIKVTEVLARVI